MHNIIKVFEFGNKKVRTVVKKGEVWFVARDITEALGYKNSRATISSHIEFDEKGVVKYDTPSGKQNVTIINESGLYSLILSSKMPNAKKFKRWVTNEVLPSIRKNGAYFTDNALELALNNPDYVIGLLQNLKKERESRIRAEQKADLLMHSKKTYTCTEIAKELGLSSAIVLNKFLCSKKIQYKSNGTYVLYSKYSCLGLAETKQQIFENGTVLYSRHFTQKGREFILNLVKNEMQ